MNTIEVDHLTKKFGELVAVDDISFNVSQGEIFGLLGPNGAGKTTLIRMMTTLTPPTSGTARIAGHDIRTDPDGVRQVLGVIPQAFTSDPELTARENMLIHAKLYGVPSSERAELIRKSAGIGGFGEVSGCSGPYFFGRHEATVGNCTRAGSFTDGSVSRRADDRPRSRLAHERLGIDPNASSEI